ncbi:Protein dyf-7 [Caenorhabditis elegans]|uniref:Protein dyf-7 n=1 Tax=Caenorhabditis elegans TaxID=6239 RepID=DYF7_CAEEL|nr:Protein dyf-7 [Caenorhabditis elegans]Q09276.2 RecName: Full=Protein dyf-7; AltName: Full=Abnormal dye filling protein 7; Flags: Precursor [Caenorhabditis elegans]CAA87330.2 Protein dyf-7 [Caenorhabditis elegans]|eukprot:NP_509630.1 Protein dyf-7 [Caenorhabditis elegans]
MNQLWRASCLQVLITFLLIHQNKASEKDRFVELVDCIADSFTVVLNKSDPEVMRMISNPKSQPVVYVYGHKTRHPCGTSMKDEKGLTNFNLTIPYGSECDVTLTDLPKHRYAETTVVLEDNADLSFGKTTRLNHVFCLYTRNVKTIRFSDVSNGHEVIASTGGKPKPKVEMLFRSTDSGKTLQAARENEFVEFFIALSPDSAYHGISPKECTFSDREDISAPDAKKITFVQGGCPVNGMNDIIDPLANVNDQIYFSKFRTFRFGNQSTVFVHCQVQVCLKKDECSKTCYKKVSDSNLTAERLRFRHKRSITDLERRTTRSAPTDDNGSLDLTNSLTVVSRIESAELVASPISQPTIVDTPSEQRRDPCPKSSNMGFIPLIIMGSLASLLLFSAGAAIYFGCKLKSMKKKDSFDMMSAFSNPTVSMPVTYSHYQRSAYNASVDSLYR